MRSQMQNDAKTTDYLKALPQYLLPGHLLSRLVFALTRVRCAPFRKALIRLFIRRFRVDMGECERSDPVDYAHFNDFFTRSLKAGTRPLPEEPDALTCPVDGTVSQVGRINEGRIFQAKGHDYSVEELLGSAEAAVPFRGGMFATIYLAPSNYHRIHMPLDGTLTEMVHVPGRLFSVNPATARAVPRLFARNERVVSLFDTAVGPMALVKVGALFVAGIETVWAGLVTPPAGRTVRRWVYPREEAPALRRGEEMGRFNMGSTVILLFGPDAVAWAPELAHGSGVCMGQPIGSRAGSA